MFDPALLTYEIADGRCVIDLMTAPGVTSDQVSNAQVAQAARRVIDQCVAGTGPIQGGSVGAIGESYPPIPIPRIHLLTTFQGNANNLVVIVRRYTPAFSCNNMYGQPPTAGSCRRIIGNMPVSTDAQVFGWKRAQGVQIPLPKNFRAGTDRSISWTSPEGYVISC